MVDRHQGAARRRRADGAAAHACSTRASPRPPPQPAPSSATAPPSTASMRDATGRVTAALVADRRRDAAASRAGLVIGADGRRSKVARAVGAPVTRAGRHAARVDLRLCRGPRRPRLPLALRPRRRRRRHPHQRRAHVVFAGVPTARFRGLAASHRTAALARAPRARCIPALAAEVAAGPAGVAGRSPSPASRASCAGPAGPGWALVGDAGYFKDPITAHGITDALRDAELLAGARPRRAPRRRSPATPRRATSCRCRSSRPPTRWPRSTGPSTRRRRCTATSTGR